MATAKKRTVHFFEPIRVRPDDTEIVLKGGFWKALHDKVSSLKTQDQFVNIRGVQYRGAARHSALAASDYLYLGKTRETIDYPDSSVGDDDEQPLTLEEGGRLVEPCYLYCVRDPHNIVATLRASGGATISAVESWITHTLRRELGTDSIKLRPVVRSDQMDRLAQAKGIARFSIKLDKNKHPTDSHSDGAISQAMKNAYEGLGGGATMTLEWSYGNANPPQSGMANLIEQVREMLGWNAAKSAEATVIRQNENGELVRDQLDFFMERITLQIPVSESSDRVQTADVVVSALHDASKLYVELDHPLN